MANASPKALSPVISHLDGVITLSRELGKQGLYPAIDPLQSTSRLLDANGVGKEHVAMVQDVRAVLDGDGDPALANRVRRYFSQPFFVAEPYTNRPGLSVTLATALTDVRALLDGSRADIPDDALLMSGALPNT